MKKEFYLTVFLHISIICTSIINIFSTHSWMASTYFIQVTKSPILMIFISCAASTFSLFFLFCFANRHYRVFPIASAFFSVPFLAIEIYFGFILRFDIEKFFEMQIPYWANKHGSAEINFIQRKFQCCGFFDTTDFPASECSMNYCVPCLEKLSKALSDPLKGCGTYIFSVAFVRVITIVLFGVAYNEDEDLSIIDENDLFLP